MSRKMMRVPAIAVAGVAPDVVSLARAMPGGARRARWNQGCWSEVWLMTSSVMTRSAALVRGIQKRLEARAASP